MEKAWKLLSIWDHCTLNPSSKQQTGKVGAIFWAEAMILLNYLSHDDGTEVQVALQDPSSPLIQVIMVMNISGKP